MEHGPGHEFYWREGPHHAHEGWWGGPLHLIVLVLVVAVLVAGVMWLVRRLAPGVAQATPPPVAGAPAGIAPAVDQAVATLRMRYAKGEVSREDYLHAMEDLTGAAAPATPPSEEWPGVGPDEDTTPTAG